MRFLIFVLLITAFDSMADNVTADSLRKRMMNDQGERDSASKRLKLLRNNNSHLRSLSESDLFYQLPDGRRVKGVLLPNGKLSPGVINNGVMVPACLTTSGLLVAGNYDNERKVIDCSISNSEIAYIDDNIYGGKDYSKPDLKKPVGINKYSNSKEVKQKKISKSEKSNHSRPKQKPKSTPKPVANPYIYKPSKASGKPASTVVYSLGANEKFGVDKGVWAKVRLERPVSSADSGLVEYVLQEDVVGRFKTLPAGSKFFGSKRINSQTKKLESMVDSVLLPDGDGEIKLSAWIFSLNKTAGLNGRVVRDREGENDAASKNAALRGLGVAAGNLTGAGNVAGVVVDSYTNDMVTNEQRYASDMPGATIHVSPQMALIQFSGSF